MADPLYEINFARKIMTLYEILYDYTQWLLDHGYCDDDVWCEPPKAVDRFFEDRKVYIAQQQLSGSGETPSPKSAKADF